MSLDLMSLRKDLEGFKFKPLKDHGGKLDNVLHIIDTENKIIYSDDFACAKGCELYVELYEQKLEEENMNRMLKLKR